MSEVQLRPEAAAIRAQAEQVAAGWSTPGAPESWQLTAALFTMIAGHDELLAALASLPPDRLPALLASAAVSFLIRRDRPEQLAGYFPEPGLPQPPFDPDFGPLAHAYVADRLDDVLQLCRSRRYQMNEVARCTQVAAGIAAVCGPRPGPVALADLGTGAGLGLQLDRYRYRFGEPDLTPQPAELTLSCEVRGSRRPPAIVLPAITHRAGIELNPVDLEDAAARAWLTACAPPEASALGRLTAAIALARRTPAPIVTGDAVDALPALLAGFPPELPVIVVDAYLAVFLPGPRRAELAGVLADAARTRPITWLSLDPLIPLGPTGRDSVQGVPIPAGLVADYQQHGVFAVLGARTFDRFADHGRLLARAHPSGRWIEWIGSPVPETGGA